MRKVNPDEHGTTRLKLTPEDLEEDVAILTIASYDEIDVDDPDTPSGTRKSGILTFEETEDKVLWLNKGQVQTLVERLGSDADEWIGQQIPLEKVKKKFGSKTYHKVYVMDGDEWDEYLEPPKPVRRVRKRTAAKKAPRGNGRRKKARGRRR